MQYIGPSYDVTRDQALLIESMTAAADFEGLARSGWSATAMASAAASLALVHSWNPTAAASMRAMLTMPLAFGGTAPSSEQLKMLDALVNRLAASACGAAAASACCKTYSSSNQSLFLMQQFKELLLEAERLLGLQQCEQGRPAHQSDSGLLLQQQAELQAQQLAGLLRHLST